MTLHKLTMAKLTLQALFFILILYGATSSTIVPLSELRKYVFGGADLQYRVYYQNCTLQLAHISPYNWEQVIDEMAYTNHNDTDWTVTTSFARDVNGQRLGLKGPVDRLTMSMFTATGVDNMLYDRNPATGKTIIPGYIYCKQQGTFEIMSRRGMGSELPDFKAVSKSLLEGKTELRFNLNLDGCSTNQSRSLFNYAGRISGFRLDNEQDIAFATSFKLEGGYYVIDIKMMTDNSVTVKGYYVDQSTKISTDAHTWKCGLGPQAQLHVFQPM